MTANHCQPLSWQPVNLLPPHPPSLGGGSDSDSGSGSAQGILNKEGTESRPRLVLIPPHINERAEE